MGSSADWTLDTHIAAYAAHGIWVANWQRAGGKRSTYPEPIVPVAAAEPRDAEMFGGPGRSFEEIDEIFAAFYEKGGA